MAITSIGYPGSVGNTNIDWANMQLGMGRRYWVRNGVNVSPKTDGTRQVNISSGFAGACGVVDEVTTSTLTLPAVSSGTQWFLVGIERNWNTEESTFAYVAGGSSSATLPAIVQDGDVAGGTGIDFQPLALVPLTSGDTVPGTPIDLRVLSSNGDVLLAKDERVLQYLSGYGRQVKIGNDLWTYEAWPSAGWVKDREIVVSGPGYPGNELGFGATSGWVTVSKLISYGRRSRMTGWHQLSVRAGRTGASLPFSATAGGMADTAILNISNPEWRPPYQLQATGIYRHQTSSYHCGVLFNPDGSIGIISGAPSTEISKRTVNGLDDWSLRVNFEWMSA